MDYLETRNSTQSHGFSLFNNVFVKSNVTLIQKTQTIERSLLQIFPSIPSDLIYILRFQLAGEENSTDNVVYYFILQKTLCSKRTLVCKYCGQGKLAMEMSDHETYCGSRTERCDRCPDWVNFDFTKDM